MDILVLAPQPFFVERGTPIAVDLVLRGLSRRNDRVDVLTYHLGQDLHYEGVTIYRTPDIPFIREIRPGFSMRKLLCDLLMLLWVFPLVLRKRYQVIHAVEEAVFIALLLKFLFRIPYVYDMDSSLSEQMVERYPRLFRPVKFILTFFERLAIRRAVAVVPVCDALLDDIAHYKPGHVVILRDISLLDSGSSPLKEDLRTELGIEGPLMMYVGNLEDYQGIDLLLESFALAVKNSRNNASLVIIGGKQADIQKYQALARSLNIHTRVHFLGPKPVENLADYLAQADILVSPRIKGKNTPMKIYSYLDSGKALLATNLPTHTQVLNEDVALLVDPSPGVFSHGVLRLVEDRFLRQKLGQAAKKLVEERHTYTVFQETLNTLYDWIQIDLGLQKTAPGGIQTPEAFSTGLRQKKTTPND